MDDESGLDSGTAGCLLLSRCLSFSGDNVFLTCFRMWISVTIVCDIWLSMRIWRYSLSYRQALLYANIEVHKNLSFVFIILPCLHRWLCNVVTMEYKQPTIRKQKITSICTYRTSKIEVIWKCVTLPSPTYAIMKTSWQSSTSKHPVCWSKADWAVPSWCRMRDKETGRSIVAERIH